jgi:hypothetical protein
VRYECCTCTSFMCACGISTCKVPELVYSRHGALKNRVCCTETRRRSEGGGWKGSRKLSALKDTLSNSTAGLPARVRIPVPPSATFCLLHELLGRVRLGFLVVSPFRVACVVLHVERGRSSKQVLRSPETIHFLWMSREPIDSALHTGLGLSKRAEEHGAGRLQRPRNIFFSSGNLHQEQLNIFMA